MWSFLTCHIHCCDENHAAYHQSPCILHLTKPGRMLHNNEKPGWEIYSNLFPGEEKVLLIVLFFFFFFVRGWSVCLFLDFALEERVSAG